MCYDISQLLRSQLKRARLTQDEGAISELIDELKKRGHMEWHHTSGFAHPKIVIYTQEHPHTPTLAQWGLIPNHISSLEEAQRLWNKTVNARLETLWDKPSFKYSAQHRRCLIPVEGFFEHQHIGGGVFPHYVQLQNGHCFHLAGLWSEWRDPVSGKLHQTCAVVTTKANSLMREIHNNPKVDGPRMPAIVLGKSEEVWLNEADPEMLKSTLVPVPSDVLKTHTVRKIRGKALATNGPEAVEAFRYPEMGMF